MSFEVSNRPLTLELFGASLVHDEARTYGEEIRVLLDRVWSEVRLRGLASAGINHVVYDSGGLLFAGIELKQPYAGSECESGCEDGAAGLAIRTFRFPRYASVKHIGPYSRLPDAYSRLAEAIALAGFKPSYPQMEIYGHWNDDETKLETELINTIDEDVSQPVNP